MADERRPAAGSGCDDVRGSLELFALDALDPSERDAVLTHLDGCAGCRAELVAAEEVLGSVLLLAPGADVPAGFVEEVAGAAASREPGPVADQGRVDRRHRRPARWVGVAAACVVVALLLTGLGVALGTVFAADDQVAAPPVTTTAGARTAPLLTTDGSVAGSVAVDDAGRRLVMAVDSVVPGVAYDCVVRASSGALVTVGSWTPTTSGSARWQVSLDPDLGAVEEVLLGGPGAVTLATARLT